MLTASMTRRIAMFCAFAGLALAAWPAVAQQPGAAPPPAAPTAEEPFWAIGRPAQ